MLISKQFLSRGAGDDGKSLTVNVSRACSTHNIVFHGYSDAKCTRAPSLETLFRKKLKHSLIRCTFKDLAHSQHAQQIPRVSHHLLEFLWSPALASFQNQEWVCLPTEGNTVLVHHVSALLSKPGPLALLTLPVYMET